MRKGFVFHACLYSQERNLFPFLIFYCPGEVETKKTAIIASSASVCHQRLSSTSKIIPLFPRKHPDSEEAQYSK